MWLASSTKINCYMWSIKNKIMNKNSLVSRMYQKMNLHLWIAFSLCVIMCHIQQVKSFLFKSNYHNTCRAWSLLFIAALTLGNTPLNLNNNKMFNASIDLRSMTLFSNSVILVPRKYNSFQQHQELWRGMLGVWIKPLKETNLGVTQALFDP